MNISTKFFSVLVGACVLAAMVAPVLARADAYPFVDLKVNGSDSTVYVSAPAGYTVSWTSQGAQSCNASGTWNGAKPLSGSEWFSGVVSGTYLYTLTCWSGGWYATDSVQVVVGSSSASLTVSKLARNATQATAWLNSVNANQGDAIEFSIDVYASGAGTSYGTYVRDSVPSYLDFMEGSVRVDGFAASDTLVSSGILLGDLIQGTSKRITFSALVMSGLPVGTNVLTNTARVWANAMSEISDGADVVIAGSGTGSATLALQKSVRDTADPNTYSGIYLEDVNTLPARELEFAIALIGSGGVASQNVIVRDTLPAGLTYVSGSATVDGAPLADGIIAGGVNIGTVNAGQTRIVKFRVTVRENAYFTSFVTKLTNTAFAKGSNNSFEASDIAYLWVSKTGKVLGATDIDTGAELGLFSALMASGMGALGLSGFQVGRKAYWREKIARLRKTA